VQRAMVGFETDDVGDWVALLECGHRQHVRHRPPWQERPWVLSAEGREGRIGSALECPACDDELEPGEGGDASCMAGLVCSGCGAVLGQDTHRAGCTGGG